MLNHHFYQLAPLLLLPSVCAVFGFSLGRLIRGPRPKLDAQRAHLAASSCYLRDAYNADLSPHTRMRCAFESIYFCCLEVAGAGGFDVSAAEHPNMEVLQAGLASMSVSSDDKVAAELLADWVLEASVRLPDVSVKAACRLAGRVDKRAALLFS